jgi:hypothetical protein
MNEFSTVEDLLQAGVFSEFGVFLAADNQSTSLSWYQASLWDP